MKRPPLVSALLLSLAAIVAGGCSTHSSRMSSTPYRYKAKAIALSVTVDGVLQPTPAQFALIQAAAVKQLSPLGYVVVTDLSLAESILRINFIPNPNDPEGTGRATVMGFRKNPYYASAPSTWGTPYPTAFGYSGAFTGTNWNAMNGFGGYYGYGYYGYGSSYYDGYSYSSPTLNPITPKPTHPPLRHDPAYCPPDTQRPHQTFDRFAGHPATLARAQAYAAARESSRSSGSYNSNSGSNSSWWNSHSSSSDYSGGSSSYSSASSSYSRSDYSSSSSAPSYSSSYSSSSSSPSVSASSYSAPSVSSSDYSSSSSSSSSSSGGSSGTQDSSPTQQAR